MSPFKKKQKQAPQGRNPHLPPPRSEVFSYHGHRSKNESPTGRAGEISRHSTSINQITKWHYIPSFVALIGVVISTGYLLTLDTNPKITISPGEGNTLLQDADIYQVAARKELTGSIMNRSKVTINTFDTARNLQMQFPEIDQVAITLPLAGRRPIISITAAEPSIILATNSGSYVLDDKGRAIRKASQISSSATAALPVVSDETSLSIEVGKNVLPKQTVKFITGVMTQLQAKQSGAESLTLPAVANELHVRPRGQSYYLKFNTEGEPALAVGTFMAVKQRIEANEQFLPTEYIDLRIQERAYIK